MLCFRFLNDAEPANPIADAVASLAGGHSADGVFIVDPGSFSQIPNSPFAYWISERTRRIFGELPRFEGNGQTVKQGLATADDFRFIRAAWEVPCEPSSSAARTWFSFAKGGSYSPFYSDLFLKVNWKDGGWEITNNLNANGLPRSNIWMLRDTAQSFFLRPGLTWPRRTNGLSFRVLPSSSVFADKGPAAFVEGDSVKRLWRVLALCNSTPFYLLVSVQLARVELAQSFEVGLIQNTPLPDGEQELLADLARKAWIAKRVPDTASLISHAFVAPALTRGVASLAEGGSRWSALLAKSASTFAETQRQIDDIAFRLYGIGEGERQAVEQMLGVTKGADHAEKNAEQDEDNDDETIAKDLVSLVSELGDYVIGCAFGHWDIRYATGDLHAPELPDPFAALPVCPPGMLQGADGLPLSPEAGRRLRAEGRYPLDVAWDGILVDDPEHPLDLERRVDAGLKVIWGDRTDDIEHEACSLLGVPNLGEWFRRPGGFFADHLKRYSKSRRQAPIYWPLSTASGSYTLWIYYHRLTDQTLHSCLADFIDPKIKAVESEIGQLREKKLTGKIAEKQEFLDEIRDLKTEIEQLIKLPWGPNLNDGVLITAAPLWKLFRHSKWQKDLKTCWEELQAGDYDWAHLAYNIWPQRVKQKCKTDRSLAIAHGQEDICDVEAPKPKKAKAPHKSKSAEEPEELALDQSDAKPSRTTPRISTPRPSTSSSRAPARDNDAAPPIPIEDTDRDEVMCVIRQVFSRGGAREREEALKQISEALGYQRLGTKIREILETDLLTAVRRGILTNEDGMLSLTTGDIRDFARDSLKDDFLTALGRTWKDREEAIRNFARFLGYARTGPAIEETARSLINGLIRGGRIENDGDRIRRRA